MLHRLGFLTSALVALTMAGSPAKAAILIENVTVIDGTGREPMPGRSVLVEGDHIAAIRDHAIAAPKDAAVIDGRGKFLIPGLIDTHIHLQGGRPNSSVNPTEGERPVSMDTGTGRHLLHGFLYHGVTSVQDMANYDKYIFKMREMQRSGEMISPRIFAVGYLLTRKGGYASGGGPGAVDTLDQAKQVLDPLFAQKPDLIKLIYATHGATTGPVPYFDAAMLHDIIVYCNNHGFRTSAHAPEGTMQRGAVEAGIDALAHPAYMTETDDQLAPMLAAKQIPVTTTLSVIKHMILLVHEPGYFESKPFRDILTDKDMTSFRDGERKDYVTRHMDTWAEEMFQHASTNLKKLYAAGGILALGTDRTVGAHVPQEVELIADLGIPPLQVIRIATLNAAKYMHQEAKIGSVEEGKLADLLLLDADPSKDVRNVRKINTVIANGKVIDRSQLDLPVNHREAR
jgi:imidazolonepropionase-like amidohydrolase